MITTVASKDHFWYGTSFVVYEQSLYFHYTFVYYLFQRKRKNDEIYTKRNIRQAMEAISYSKTIQTKYFTTHLSFASYVVMRDSYDS